METETADYELNHFGEINDTNTEEKVKFLKWLKFLITTRVSILL